MLEDFFSLKDPFEEKTGKDYEEYSGFQKVWKRTPTYAGLGILDPYDLSPIARILVEEGGIKNREGHDILIKNADDAIRSFYFFVDNLTDKDVRAVRDGHYGQIILDNADYCDSYGMRTILKGKGICNHIAAAVLGLCRGVGIPSVYTKKKGHGWVDAWTDETGWIHVGYSEGILCSPEKDIFKKFLKQSVDNLISRQADPEQRYLKMHGLLSNTLEKMVKYGFCAPERSYSELSSIFESIPLPGEMGQAISDLAPEPLTLESALSFH